MDLGEIFVSLRPITTIVTMAAGFVIGFFVVSMTPTSRSSSVAVAFMLFIIGLSYYIPLIVGRAIEAVPNWERTVGVWVIWNLFIFMMSLGIHIKNRLRG